MGAVLAVVVSAVVIGGVARGRIGGILERHVTLAALDRLLGITLVIPAALAPVVVLVLELDPADLIDLFVDKLFVTGATVFGGLVERTGERLHVLFWIGTDEEIADLFAQGAGMSFVGVAHRLAHGVVGVSADVGLYDGMTNDAGNSFVGAERGEAFDIDVLAARKQSDGIVTTRAVSRGFGTDVIEHELLDGLEGNVG